MRVAHGLFPRDAMLQCCVPLSVVCDVCIVAKRCVIEQKLLMTA